MPAPRIPANCIAGQLARPHGLLAGRTLDSLERHNGERMRACVARAEPAAGETAADFGFGGGAGLQALLDRVGPSGRVHGVEPSRAARRRATQRFRHDIRSGRLSLHDGTLTDAPLPSAGLDVVVSTNTLYFVPDLEPVGLELGRLTAPGARIVIGVADPDVMRRSGMPLKGFTLRPVDDLVSSLTASGSLRCLEVLPLADDVMAFTLLVFTRQG